MLSVAILTAFFGRHSASAGRSTLNDIEPVTTTFSAETNWSSINIGSLVVVLGMMLVSNQSNRRERALLIIFVVSGSLIYSTLRAARILQFEKPLDDLHLSHLSLLRPAAAARQTLIALWDRSSFSRINLLYSMRASM